MLAGAASLAGTLGACGGNPSANAPVVRDSAGVAIVDNGPVAADAVAGWRILRRPVFRTGWADDEPTFEWIFDGRILPDGGVILADYGADKIYELDPEGRVLRTMGGPGQGPGEFSGLESVVHLGGDSVLAYDPSRQRASLFVDGAFAGDSRRVLDPAFSYQVRAAFADGTVLLYPYAYSRRPEPGWYEAAVLRASPDLTRVDTVLLGPGVYVPGGDDHNPLTYHQAWVEGAGDGFAYARTDRAEVRWFGPEGDLLRIARWDHPWREWDVSLWDEYERGLREHLGGSPEMSSERTDRYVAQVREDIGGRFPIFWNSGMHGDPEGNVWLGDPRIPLRVHSERYLVVRADGGVVGYVEFPRPMEILDIGTHHLLVVERDDYDIPAVALYRIDK